MELREYQQYAINKSIEWAEKGLRRHVISLATGAGKSYVALGLIKYYNNLGIKVAYFDNRIQRINQFHTLAINEGLECGLIFNKQTHGIERPLIICSIDSVRRRGFPEDIGVIIVDEVQHVSGTKEYVHLFKDRIVIGMTATPWRKSLGRFESSLNGSLFYNETIVGREMWQLMEDKWLCPFEIWSLQPPDMTDIKTVIRDGEKEFDEDEMASRFKPLRGSVIENWLERANGEQTLVFSSSIEESIAMRDLFLQIGVKADHVDCRMGDEKREKIYQAFSKKEITVLCNCILLGAGADFPMCSCVILNKKYKSKIALVQAMGRCFRLDPDNPDKISKVIDHGESIYDLSKEEGSSPWYWSTSYLDESKILKLSIIRKLKQDRLESIPSICPKCRRFVMKYPCVCGYRVYHDPKILYLPGKATLLNEQKIDKRAKKLSDFSDQELYDQLHSYAVTMKYKSGWCYYKFKEIRGREPKGLIARPVALDDITTRYIRYLQIKHRKAKKFNRT